jgi:hypothetical protein
MFGDHHVIWTLEDNEKLLDNFQGTCYHDLATRIIHMFEWKFPRIGANEFYRKTSKMCLAELPKLILC